MIILSILQTGIIFKYFLNRISELGHDTVGAVALDRNGRIAAATSTGGITGKRVGRVGDSPLIGMHKDQSNVFFLLRIISIWKSGCGTYCTDEVGGVSCTGHGESIIRICLAKHVIGLMEKGMIILVYF